MGVNLWDGDQVSVVLKKGLDTAVLRQEVIANNLANANTPLFKRSTVMFEDHLRQALGKETGRRTVREGVTMEELAPRVVRDHRNSMRMDLNNVDVDQEMVFLSGNQIKYNALTQFISDRYSNLRYVINEGRR